MSFQKINEILTHGSVINYDLASTGLSSALTEIINLIIQHEKQITDLQKTVEKCMSKEDFAAATNQNNESINKIRKEIEENNNYTEARLDNLTRDVTTVKENQTDALSEFQDKFAKQMASKDQSIEGQFFVFKQQIRDIHIQIGHLQESSEQSSESIKKIQEKFVSSKENSLDLLNLRLTKAEGSLNELTHNSDEAIKKLINQVKTIQEHTQGFESDIKGEVHYCSVGIEELRHMVVDAPDLTTDGVLDTQSVVRCIQRDSRRIDNFDETINALRDDHNNLRSTIAQIADGFNQIQNNMIKVIHQYNNEKEIIFRRINEESEHSNSVAQLISKVMTDQQAFVETEMSNTASLVNSILQVRNLLTRITTRTIPNFSSLDDAPTALQSFYENMALKPEIIEKSINFEPQFTLSDFQPITLPYIEITLADSPEKIKKSNIETYKARRSEKDQNISSIPVISSKTDTIRETEKVVVDGNVQKDIDALRLEITTTNEKLESMREGLTLKIDRKVDSTTLEKTVDKLRATIKTIRDAVNGINKELGTYLTKDDIEDYMKENNTKGRNSPIEKFHLRAKSPMAKTTGRMAHDILYKPASSTSDLPPL